MADIATIGFRVDTKGLNAGTTALKRFSEAGLKTEKAILAASKKISSSFVLIEKSVSKTQLKLMNFGKGFSKQNELLTSSLNKINAALVLTQKSLMRTSSLMQTFGNKTLHTEKQVTTATKHMHGGFSSLVPMIQGIVTMMGIMAAVMLPAKVVEYSDTWKNLSSQLRQVTQDEKELIATREKLLSLSRETRTDLSSTVNLFAEITRGTKDLNLSQERTIGVVKTLNNLFLAGGKPISEVSGAIRQLNQGFASGVLRGDEFNSVADGAPKVLDALSESLGISRGKLRDFAATGGITAEIMVTALEKYNKTAQKLADQTEITFGQKMVQAQTNMIEFTGKAKNLNDAIGMLGTGLLNITKNLEPLTDGIKTAAMVAGGIYVASLTKAGIATASVMISTIAYEIELARMSGLLGVYAVRAGVATVATRALGVATKFLLGPWGLLLAALGAGVSAFISSKNKADDLSETLDQQKTKLAELSSAYDKFSKERLGNTYVEAQKKAIEIDRKRIEINEKLTEKLKGTTSVNSFGTIKFDKKGIDDLKSQLQALDVEANKLKLIMDAVGTVFEKGLPKGEEAFSDISKAAQKVLDRLEPLRVKTNSIKTQFALLRVEFERGNITSDRLAERYFQLQAELENLNKVSDPVAASFKEQEKALALQELQKLTDQVDNFGGSWSRTGSIIVDTFGSIADSLNDYSAQMNEIGKQEKDLSALKEKLGKDDIQVINLTNDIAQNKNSAQLKMMSSLSSAGASLFGEQTAAAKALFALNKIIAVAEIAMSFKKMAAKTTETSVVVAENGVQQTSNALTSITSAFSAPFPVNFVAGAAMIGIMASLLGKSFGGGSVQDPTQQRQDTQGTGSVLGSSGKSGSISQSQDRFEQINIDQLKELRGIRDSIRSLSSGIKQLTKSVITSGLDDFKGITGVTSSSLGGLFSKTTKSVIDNGIQFVSQSLGSIIDDGIVQAQAFFDIKTKKKKFFGLSSSESVSTETQGIDNEIQKQMAAIFGSIGDSVLQAADILGFKTVDVVKTTFDTSSFDELPDFVGSKFGALFGTTTETVNMSLQDALNSFQVDIGKVSLEGLSGDEIQKELEAVFSKQADLIAEFLVPSIAEYQQVGEGLFDTLTRVANEQVFFNDAIDKLGFDLTNLSNIMQIDVAQSVIELSGGFEQFSDLTNSFIDNFFTQADKTSMLEQSLNESFSSLGLSMVSSREEFKNLVQGIDLTTESGQALFAALLEINPALADYLDELERVESKRVSLQIELMKLQGDASGALAAERELELAALDETLRPLQELIFAEQDRIKALKEQQDLVKSSFDMLKKSIDLEKQRAQAILDTAKDALNTELDRISGLRDALNAEKSLRDNNLELAKTALNKAFDQEKANIQSKLEVEVSAIQDASNERISALNDNLNIELDAIKTASNARVSALNNEKALVTSSVNSLRALVNSINGSLGLSKSLDLSDALSAAQAGDFSKAKNLDLGALTNLDPNKFASAQDLAIQKAINANRLQSISGLASNKLSSQEQLLKSIDNLIKQEKSSTQLLIEDKKKQTALLIEKEKENTQKSIDALKEKADEQISALDDQLNSLLNIDTSILSVANAVANFQTAQADLDALNYDAQLANLDLLVESANDVFNLYQQGFDDEIARLDDILDDNELLLNAAIGIDASVLSVAEAITALEQSITDLATQQQSSNVVNNGNITILPPNDKNIIPLPPVKPIDYPNSDNTKTLEEIINLRTENAQLQREIVKNTKSTARILQRFELDGLETRQIP